MTEVAHLDDGHAKALGYEAGATLEHTRILEA